MGETSIEGSNPSLSVSFWPLASGIVASAYAAHGAAWKRIWKTAAPEPAEANQEKDRRSMTGRPSRGSGVRRCQAQLEQGAGRHYAGVLAGGRDELYRGGKPVLGGATRQRQRRPAERVEGVSEADHRVADLDVVLSAGGATNASVGVTSRSTPSIASAAASRYSSRRRRRPRTPRPSPSGSARASLVRSRRRRLRARGRARGATPPPGA